MIYDTVITGVNSKVVNRKSDGRAITIYEITDANNITWTTSRRDIANEANRLINQTVTVQGREEQRGTFLNHFLEDLRPSNGSRQAAPQPQTQGHPLPQAPPSPREAPIASWTANGKDYNIMRQTAAKVSAHLSGSPMEFWANVDDLVSYFDTGKKPDRFSRYVPPEVMSGVTSHGLEGPRQFIPESYEDDPGPDPTKPDMYDNDIPF